MSELGEKEFLAKVLPALRTHEIFINGFGDDAAVLDLPAQSSQRLVFKIDRAAQPTATRRGWADNSMWGRLAVTATCSDILAAGAHPRAFMLACILPGTFAVEQAAAIIDGCANECADNDVAFVGGDTKEGPSPEIVGTGIGLTSGPSYFGRRGAAPGDAIVLAGKLGGYLGAYALMMQIDHSTPEDRSRWIAYLTHPRAQWEAAKIMNGLQIATAAMDCSDGIYDALAVLSGALGCEVYEPQLPYHALAKECEQKLGLQPLSMALGVGDWNIVYIVPQAHLPELMTESKRVDSPLRVIGKISEGTTGDVQVRDRNGRLRRLRREVNEHFIARQEDEGSLLQRIALSPYAD